VSTPVPVTLVVTSQGETVVLVPQVCPGCQRLWRAAPGSVACNTCARRLLEPKSCRRCGAAYLLHRRRPPAGRPAAPPEALPSVVRRRHRNGRWYEVNAWRSLCPGCRPLVLCAGKAGQPPKGRVRLSGRALGLPPARGQERDEQALEAALTRGEHAAESRQNRLPPEEMSP
jgi:hypothetical protein